MNIAAAALQGLLLLTAIGAALILVVRLAREAAPGLGRLMNAGALLIVSACHATRKAIGRRRGR